MVNFYLTFLELTIFKFSFLTACNVLMTLIRGNIDSYPQIDLLIIIAFLVLMFIQLLSFFLNITKIWTRRCAKIPIALLYIIIFLGFVGINIYL